MTVDYGICRCKIVLYFVGASVHIRVCKCTSTRVAKIFGYTSRGSCLHYRSWIRQFRLIRLPYLHTFLSSPV